MKSFFEKLTIMHIMQLKNIEGKGVHMYHIQALHNQFNTMSHTWPRNPHIAVNSQIRLPPHKQRTTRILEPLIVLSQTIQLPSRF